MSSTLLFRKRPQRRGTSTVVMTLGALALLLLGCSDDITTPGAVPQDTLYEGSFDAQSGVLEFGLTAQPGQVLPPLRLVATDIRMDTEGLLHAQVFLRNVGSESVLGPAGVLVSHFLPTSVYPVNASCPRAGDSSDPASAPFPPCFFDHRGTYGDDGLLAGGESSEPVEWIFSGTGGESFGFQAQLVLEPAPSEGLITGTVFEDSNENGLRDPSEPGIAGVGVGLEVGDHVRLQVTDANGHYAFEVTEAGLYRLLLSLPEGARATGPTELQVVILRNDDGSLSSFVHGDFGLVTTTSWEDLRIEGVVFLDSNRNGIRERGETGVAGVQIGASSSICMLPVAAQARTDANGFYTILGADVQCPPPWIVNRLPLEGHLGTTPDWVELAQPPPPGGVFRVDFGVAPEDSVPHPVDVTITGVVFLDRDGNGLRDNDDEPIPGVQMQLLSPCDFPLEATTDDTGRYVFPPDVVRLCPVDGVWQARPEFIGHTTPNPVAIQIPTVPGNHLIRVDFGIGPER